MTRENPEDTQKEASGVPIKPNSSPKAAREGLKLGGANIDAEEDLSVGLEGFWDQGHFAPPVGVLKGFESLSADPEEGKICL